VEGQPGGEGEALELYEQAIAETNAMATQDSGIRDARRIAEERIAELHARMAAQAREPASAEDPAENPQENQESTSAPDAPPSESGEGGPSVVGPIVLGVGGAMMLAGAITGALALAEHGELRGMCDEEAMRCPAATEERMGGLSTLSISTDVLLWGGLAVAATGALLTFLVREESGATVSAACDGTGCAAFVMGSF